MGGGGGTSWGGGDAGPKSGRMVGRPRARGIPSRGGTVGKGGDGGLCRRGKGWGQVSGASHATGRSRGHQTPYLAPPPAASGRTPGSAPHRGLLPSDLLAQVAPLGPRASPSPEGKRMCLFTHAWKLGCHEPPSCPNPRFWGETYK